MNKINVFFCGIEGWYYRTTQCWEVHYFNALTKFAIPIENYQFCTIEINVGIVKVTEHRLNDIADIIKLKPITSATQRQEKFIQIWNEVLLKLKYTHILN